MFDTHMRFATMRVGERWRGIHLARQDASFSGLTSIRGSIVASISACHADDPGSIPGRGETLCIAAS